MKWFTFLRLFSFPVSSNSHFKQIYTTVLSSSLRLDCFHGSRVERCGINGIFIIELVSAALQWKRVLGYIFRTIVKDSTLGSDRAVLQPYYRSKYKSMQNNNTIRTVSGFNYCFAKFHFQHSLDYPTDLI